jgi:ribose transport system permease protein
MQQQSKGRIIYRKYGTYIILIVLIILLSIFADGFLSLSNLTNILRTTSIYAVLGCGMTFVMLSGKIDLSVGSIMALVGCVAALCLKAGYGVLISTLIGLAVGVVCGLINGFCIAKLRVPFFIMTAGMMYMASGIALVFTHETSIGIYSNGTTGLKFDIWGARTFLDNILPSQFIIAAIFFVICFYILKNTKMGRYTYAIGSNVKTAKLSGVNINKYTILIFTLNGLAAAIAGIIMASRLKMGSPTVGEGYEIDAIAAAAIGGTSMSGGEGSIVKTMVGAFILCIIRTGLNVIGVSSSNQKIIIGAILVLVVALDMLDKRKSE